MRHQTKAEILMLRLNMDEVFMTPLLPYKNYITEHGLHEVGQGIGMGEAKHYQARYEFPDQQIKVSLIHGPLFHCNYDGPYEWRITYPDGAVEPEGYKTEEELYILLTKILGGSYGIPE